MTTASNPSAPSIPSLVSASPSDATLPGAMEQAQRFAPRANALPADQVRVARIDPQVVARNVKVGVAALNARRAEVATLPGILLAALDELPDMSLGLIWVCGECERFEPVTGHIDVLRARASKARKLGLLKADVLVAAGIIPASVVAGIRRGHGLADVAGDCISLSSLFHKYQGELDGHVKITDADIQELNDSGVALMSALRAPGTPREPIQEQKVTTDQRDRLWTLLDLTWTEHVWRPGAWLFGREMGEHIPLLSSRTHERKAPTPAPEPTPVPAPAPVATIGAPNAGSGS